MPIPVAVILELLGSTTYQIMTTCLLLHHQHYQRSQKDKAMDALACQSTRGIGRVVELLGREEDENDKTLFWRSLLNGTDPSVRVGVLGLSPLEVPIVEGFINRRHRDNLSRQQPTQTRTPLLVACRC